jgi:outer membrane protein
MKKFIFLIFCLFLNTQLLSNTLEEALSLAYKKNPSIQAKRANLRSNDELVSISTSEFYPKIRIIGSYGETVTNYNDADEIKLEPSVAKVEAEQIIFSGGRLLNNRYQSLNFVAASRADLNILEQEVLFSAAEAFFNVLTNQKIVELREVNLDVLNERLEVAKIQFEVGELTLTDVAQSEARLSLSQANLAEARSNLEKSKAIYKSIIGVSPINLSNDFITFNLPTTIDEALSIANAESPYIKFAEKSELSSRYGIKSAKSKLLPSLSLKGEFSNSEEMLFNMDGDAYQLMGVLSMPIFSGGLNWSNIRKAQEINVRDKFQLVEARRFVTQEVKSAFSQYNSSLIKVNSSKKQFEANKIALEGVKEEFELGTRTNLDVLDAEQEFLDSQVSMISSENNSKLSMFYLLLSVGSLNPDTLSLPVSKYDPNLNYNKVKNIKLGWKRFKDIKNLD